MYGQAQAVQQPESAAAGNDLLQQLQALGWVDTTAIAVMLVFFVIGLFKGLFWQVSRIGILLVSYVVAGQFGGTVGAWLARTPAAAPAAGEQAAGAGPDTLVYLSYVLVFLAAVVVLSLIAMQLQKLVKKTGLGFFDRIGGGLFGIATGACSVLFLLFVVNMFFRDTVLGTDAQASHSQRLSREAIDWLGPRVPDDLRGALYLTPLRATAPTTPAGPDGGAPPAGAEPGGVVPGGGPAGGAEPGGGEPGGGDPGSGDPAPRRGGDGRDR